MRDVLVRFRIADDGTASLERIGSEADEARGKLDKAGREGKEAGDKIDRGARHGATGLGDLNAKLAGLIGAYVGVQAIKGAFEAIIGTTARFESLGRTLQTVMGSVEGGQQAMRWITDFAAQTPYQLDQVTGAFLQLRNAGIDPTGPSMKAIGDAVAAFSGGSQEHFGRVVTAISQIANKGKLSAEELRQLAEANIPVYQILQDELGLTGEQVADIGNQGITAAEGLDALFRGIEARVGGAMADQMTTLNGLWSYFKDQVSLALVTIGTPGGALEALKDVLGRISNTVQDLVKSGALAKMGQDFGGLVTVLGTLLSLLTAVVRGWLYLRDTVELVVVAIQAAVFTMVSDLASKFATILEWFVKLDFTRGRRTEQFRDMAQWFRDAATDMGDAARESAVRVGELSEAMLGYREATDDAADATGALAMGGTASAGGVGLAGLGQKLADVEARVNSSLGYWRGLRDEMTSLEPETEGVAEAQEAANAAVQQATADLDAYIDKIDVYHPIEPPDAERWRQQLGQVRLAWEEETVNMGQILEDSLKASLEAVFAGDFEGLEDVWASFTGAFASQVSSGLVDSLQAAFSSGGGGISAAWAGLTENAEQNRAGYVLGGLGTVYQASQQQSRTAGTLQGAMGGAMAGMPWAEATGGLSVIIGAIVGGLVGYFTSGSESPRTWATIGAEGADITDTSGHQYYSAPRRLRWEQSMNAVYLNEWRQYRGLAEMLGDPEALGRMGELPSWSTGTGGLEISADELARLLADTVLPAEFHETFREVFRTGLERLGVSDAMFEGLEAALARLPGSERLRLLEGYITTVAGLWELTDQLTNLRAGATQDPFDAWRESYAQVMTDFDVFRAGWDDLDLAMQVDQGGKILDLLSQWGRNAEDTLRGLIEATEEMSRRADSLRERIITRGMEPWQAAAYNRDQYFRWSDILSGATTPGEAQYAYGEAMRYLETMVGMEGSAGFSDAWLLQQVDLLEGVMRQVMGGFQSEVEAQADAIASAIGDVLADLLVGPTGGGSVWDGPVSEFGGAVEAVVDELGDVIEEGFTPAVLEGKAAVEIFGSSLLTAAGLLDSLSVSVATLVDRLAGTAAGGTTAGGGLGTGEVAAVAAQVASRLATEQSQAAVWG